MSGNAQLAQTGLPTLVIGGAVYPIGLWFAVAAGAVVLGLTLFLKFGWRRGVTAGQLAPVTATPKSDRSHRRGR